MILHKEEHPSDEYIEMTCGSCGGQIDWCDCAAINASEELQEFTCNNCGQQLDECECIEEE